MRKISACDSYNPFHELMNCGHRLVYSQHFGDNILSIIINLLDDGIR